MRTTYQRATERVRQYQAGLLGEFGLARLRAMPRLSELVSFLGASPYADRLGKAFEQHGGARAVIEACRLHVADVIASIHRLYDSDGQRVVEARGVRFDLSNLRTILRSQYAGLDGNAIIETLVPAGAIDDATLRTAASQGHPRLTSAWLSKVHPSYSRTAREAILAYEESHDWLVFDATLDRAFFSALLARASRGTDNDLVFTELLRTEIDVRNTQAVLTLRQQKRCLDPQATRRVLVQGGSSDALRFLSLAAAREWRDFRGALRQIPIARSLELLPEAEIPERLEVEFARYGASLLDRDPMTVSPALGLIEAKRAEAEAIALIARDLMFGDGESQRRA